MFEAMIAVMTLIILYLGVRIFLKVREMSTWRSEDESAGDGRRISIPQEILEPRIEDPSAGELGSTDRNGREKSNNGTGSRVSR